MEEKIKNRKIRSDPVIGSDPVIVRSFGCKVYFLQKAYTVH